MLVAHKLSLVGEWSSLQCWSW